MLTYDFHSDVAPSLPLRMLHHQILMGSVAKSRDTMMGQKHLQIRTHTLICAREDRCEVATTRLVMSGSETYPERP